MTEKRPTGRAARAQDEKAVQGRERLASWAKGLSDTVVDSVIYYRDFRGMKNAALRERLSSLGWNLTENSLASILSRKRATMPVSDIMLFAEALNVPPAALLFPTYKDQPGAISPVAEKAWPGFILTDWFAGRTDLPSGALENLDFDSADDFYEVGDVVQLLVQMTDLLQEFERLNTRLWDLSTRDHKAAADLRNLLNNMLTDIASDRHTLRAKHPGMFLPTLRSELAFLDGGRSDWPALPISPVSDNAST